MTPMTREERVPRFRECLRERGTARGGPPGEKSSAVCMAVDRFAGGNLIFTGDQLTLRQRMKSPSIASRSGCEQMQQRRACREKSGGSRGRRGECGN